MNHVETQTGTSDIGNTVLAKEIIDIAYAKYVNINHGICVESNDASSSAHSEPLSSNMDNKSGEVGTAKSKFNPAILFKLMHALRSAYFQDFPKTNICDMEKDLELISKLRHFVIKDSEEMKKHRIILLNELESRTQTRTLLYDVLEQNKLLPETDEEQEKFYLKWISDHKIRLKDFRTAELQSLDDMIANKKKLLCKYTKDLSKLQKQVANMENVHKAEIDMLNYLDRMYAKKLDEDTTNSQHLSKTKKKRVTKNFTIACEKFKNFAELDLKLRDYGQLTAEYSRLDNQLSELRPQAKEMEVSLKLNRDVLNALALSASKLDREFSVCREEIIQYIFSEYFPNKSKEQIANILKEINIDNMNNELLKFITSLQVKAAEAKIGDIVNKAFTPECKICRAKNAFVVCSSCHNYIACETCWNDWEETCIDNHTPLSCVMCRAEGTIFKLRL